MIHGLSNHSKGIIYGLLSAISVSGYVLVNRHVYNQYDVEPFNYAVTFAVVAGGFGALAILFDWLKTGKNLVSSNNFPKLFLLGLAGGLAMALVVVGQNLTTAINTAIVMTFSVIATAIFSRLILREQFSRAQQLWLVVMFVGLYLGVVGLHILKFQPGDLIILAAMVVLGFNNTFSKLLIKDLNANFVADARLAISAALMLLAGFLVVGSDMLVVNAGLWPILSGMFLWTCIRTFYMTIHYASPNQAIVLNNSQIFFTALVGVVLLSEVYDWVKFLGSAVVLLSVYFITKK